MKILVIDDEEDIRRIIRMALERLGGMVVCEASGGLEGLTAARQERPDAILLDMMMWGMDGTAVLQALRGNPETAAIPVVFITASAAPEDMQRSLGLGAAGVIAKPFDPMTLANQLQTLLKPAAHAENGNGKAGDDLASVMTALYREYRRELPAKLERLSQLAGQTEAAPDDAALRAELVTAVHNLHGTAGTYGFTRISRIAGDWETELKADAGKTLNPAGRAAHYLAALGSPEAAAEKPPLAFLAAQPVPQATDAPGVLIVDDDPDLAAFFAALLRADGLHVETVSNASDALDRLLTTKPALIISDVAMPGTDGYDLCRTVRARGLQDVPFIFCTVLGDKAQRIEGLWCGADDYLVKPVEPEELRLKVRNHIARMKQPHVPGPAPA